MKSTKTFLVFGLILSLFMNLLLFSKWASKRDDEAVKNMNIAFSGYVNDPKTLLLKEMNHAKEKLDIAIYNLEDKDIVQSILQAHHRGVDVRLITDSKKAEKDKRADILDQLVDQDVAVKINTARKMHLKLAVIDEERIVTGSYNYTQASANDNLEQLMMISDESAAIEWTDIYEKIWNDDELSEWTAE